MRTLPEIGACVDLGEAFMDVHDPGWWREGIERAVDLARLDMGLGDECVLGQRCPLETLTAYMGGPPDLDDDDWEMSYHAYAWKLTGIPVTDKEGLQEWAVAHGFNRPYGGTAAEYALLTEGWARRIAKRREEAAIAAGTGN